jgi:hypothetical protein
MSLYFSTGANTFACANFDATRSLAVTDSSDPRNQADSGGNVPAVVVGEIEKDELGYTHVEITFEDLSSAGSYTADVVSAPCSTLNDIFSSGASVMSHAFTANSDGTADVEFVSNAIETAATQSIVLTEGGSVVRCFGLEVAQFSLQGRLAAMTTATTDGCSAWADYYTADEVATNGRKKGKGKSALVQLRESAKKKGKSKGALDLESAFRSVDIDGTSRCCITPEADIAPTCVGKNGKRGKCTGKQSGLFSATDENRRAQTGLGAGIVGAVILAVGVAMHIRRRAKQPSSYNPDSELSEKTPLTLG